MLIGSITNQGSLQGEMNNANGYLTGVITSAGQLGGQVVGLRGLKGDKGDTGNTGATGNGIASVSKTGSSGLVDTYTITYTDGTTATFTLTNGKDGIDGIDGVDGHSPIVTASKVGKVTTVYVDGSPIATLNDGNDGVGIPVGGTIGQVLTKDSNTDYDVAWADPSGGATAFIAEYGVTTYADVKDAYDEDAIILCTVDDSGNTVVLQLAYFDDENDTFCFAQPVSEGAYWASISIGDTWDDGYFQFASTDTATQLRDGLMSALDWQKLDGIASGAEVNVNADWNAVSGDAQILNKPTIPSKTSDLNNDSGFITGMTILSYGSSTWQNFIDAYNANRVVYCRASSNSNPASGAQTRLAFMAYVNSSTPTEVEFQYYRSVSSHSASQQGDQVFVYKLNSAGTWSVTTREASSKIVAGTGLSSSYSSGVLTLTSSGEANVQSDWSQSDTTADDYIKNKPTIPTKVSELNNDSGFITGVTSTSTPTASTIAEFDASSCLNSTDMTSSEVEDFVDELDVSRGGFFLTDITSAFTINTTYVSGFHAYTDGRFVSVIFTSKGAPDQTMVISNIAEEYRPPHGYYPLSCFFVNSTDFSRGTNVSVMTTGIQLRCASASQGTGGIVVGGTYPIASAIK